LRDLKGRRIRILKNVRINKLTMSMKKQDHPSLPLPLSGTVFILLTRR
jgi:hypothetical protein